MTKGLFKISLRFYLIILGLTIPIYLLLYGATGHEFNIPAEEQLWLFIAGLSFIIATVYTLTKNKNGLTYIGLKLLFGISLIGTAYGGLKLFLEAVKFNADNSPGFFITGLSYTLTLGFTIACGLIFIGLFKIKE
jgi:hypothetical protein